jgi:putative membrane protein
MARSWSFAASVCVFGLVLSTIAANQQRTDKLLDKDFIAPAFTMSQAEVKASEMAESQANSPKVKAFAQRAAKDHTRLNEQLGQLAKDSKVAVLAGTEKTTKDMLDRLSKMKGADFDREYLKTIIDDHEKAMQIFETQSKYGTDTKLNAFAASTLPQLRDHLREAQKLLADINGK